VTEPGGSRDDAQHYVLVVDDDADIRETIETILSNYGLQVKGTRDGSEALAVLRSGRPHPCVILLDLMMPVMDGFELRARMIADPSLADIPVVVVTGAGLLADRRSAELGQGTHMLRKPFDRTTLLSTVTAYCEPGRPGPH